MSKDSQVVEKIMAAVGAQVHFRYPGNEEHKHGKLVERVVVRSPGTNGVRYWDVVDLIRFPKEAEPLWMRIGYYRKPGRRLVWGSQTTITEPISTWKRILVAAAKEKPWFRKLLKSVVAEL